MVKRILVATDFSSNADAAWRFALDLARTVGAEALLLHVTIPWPAAAPLAVRQEHERHAAATRTLLEERTTRAATAVPTKILVTTGDAAEVIAATARDERVDLVVVGTHGRDEPSELLIGSVAERVVRLAPCTVIVVKVPHQNAGSQAA